MDKLTDQIDKIKGLKQWLAHDSQKRPIVPSAFTDTENLMTYDEAVSVCRRQGLSGVGFSFIGSNICGIDLDHCIDKETGEVEEWALRIIDEIDSYTERSISGTGFHILFEANYKEQLRFDTYSVKGMRGDSLSSIEYCSKEEDRALRKDQRKHIEFYSKQGYFTLSGDVYRNKPIEERSHEGQRFFHSIKWKQTQEREERRSSQAHGYDDIREELKSHLTEYVESKTQRDPKAGKNKYICPICGSGSRGGRGSDGAFTLYPETNSFYCFSCGKGGDIFNLISEVEHLSNFRDQYKRTLELYKPDLLRKEVDKRLQAEQTDTLLTFDKITKALREDNQAIINIEGFPELTKILKLRKHDSLVLGADTGAGKSSLALNWINKLSKEFPILYFNLEMDSLTVYKRLTAIESGIEVDLLDSYNNMDESTVNHVNNAIRALTSRKPINIYNSVRDIELIEQIIKEKTSQEPHTIVIIDHMLLTTEKGSKSNYEKFTDISMKLREIALLEEITMILLCQLNREGKASNKKPTLSSLKESGGIENDATHVIFLWQEKDKEGERFIGAPRIMIRKNRNGKNNVEVIVKYDRPTQQIEESIEAWKESKEQEKAQETGSGGRKRKPRDNNTPDLGQLNI